MFCFPPTPPALLLPPPCPAFVLPLALPPDFLDPFFFFSRLGVPEDDGGADCRRSDRDLVSRRPSAPRLLLVVPSPCPSPPSAPLPSSLLFPEGADREPREDPSTPPPLVARLSLSLAGVECLSLAVPRGKGGARPPAVPALPTLPTLRDDRCLAGVVPEELLDDRRDLAGVTPSRLGFPISPSDPELETPPPPPRSSGLRRVLPLLPRWSPLRRVSPLPRRSPRRSPRRDTFLPFLSSFGMAPVRIWCEVPPALGRGGGKNCRGRASIGQRQVHQQLWTSVLQKSVCPIEIVLQYKNREQAEESTQRRNSL